MNAAAVPLTILKFGSSVLRSEEDLPAAVEEIDLHRRRGHRVVAVVSALGGTTDRLLAAADRLSPEPDPVALAALLATGETASAAMLVIALAAAGTPARLLDPRDIGLGAAGPPLDADPEGLDRAAFGRALIDSAVAVVPGFFGLGRHGIALFGRGGSDLTALHLAQCLGADACRLLKDVDGVYETDPGRSESRPARYEALDYGDALRLEARVVQRKALLFAAAHGARFEVGAPGGGPATRVGPDPTRRSGAVRDDHFAIQST